MKKLLFSFLILMTPFTVFAHSLNLSVINNNNDSITIIGKLDTGARAVGAMVRLVSEISGKKLFEKRLPQEGELTVAIPKEPYQIMLNVGPEHITLKKGIPPRNGFSVKPDKKTRTAKNRNLSVAMLVTVGTAFCLFLTTIYLSSRNTKKIIELISRKK